jgi:pantoate kinase
MDSVKFEAINSYGDVCKNYLQNPTCSTLVKEFKEIAQLLGYSPVQIYSAFSEEAEIIKNSILK